MQESNGQKFPVGSIVRVRRSSTDDGYSDRPFDGLVGRVIEVHEDVCTNCLVQWTQESLAAVSLLFGHPSKEDAMGFRETWLDEDDMEYDAGNQMLVEQPTGVPCLDNDREFRIRSIFSLFSGDPVPRACRAALLIYDDHLAVQLTLPFDGDYHQGMESPGLRSVAVVRLLQKAGVNEKDGILCRAIGDQSARGVPLAEVQVAPNSANAQLIADYCCWLRNCR